MLTLSLLILMAFVLFKFSPTYVVMLGDKEIGMVKDKEKTEQSIQDSLEHPALPITELKLKNKPKFDFKLVSRNILNEDQKEVLDIINNDMDKTYQFYQIKKDKKIIAQVTSKDEAEKIVDEIKKEREFKELKIDGIKTKQYSNTDYITAKKQAFEYVENIQKERRIKAEKERKKAEELRKAKEEQKLASRGGEIRGSVSSAAREQLKNLNMRNPLPHKRFGAHYGGYPGHTGTDLMTAENTPVRASESGTIIKEKNGTTGYGRYIVVDHGNGVHTLYAHCNNVNLLAVGTKVKKGQTIALSGNTGRTTAPHVHFEIRVNGQRINPEPYI